MLRLSWAVTIQELYQYSSTEPNLWHPQAKIQGKQLELGHKKCFQMRFGKTSECCPILNVNTKTMLTTKSEKYLAEILSSNGRIENNILARYNKGVGIVNEILGMLKEVSFGFHYFSMAMLFRQYNLVSGMLCSIETLYGLSNTDIEQLEQCDRMLNAHEKSIQLCLQYSSRILLPGSKYT